MEGLSLYNSSSYTGPALFIVSMDMIEGGLMGFYPSMSSLSTKLEHSIVHAIDEVNRLPALELIKTREGGREDDATKIGKITQTVSAEDAPLPPFKVEATLSRHPFLKSPRDSVDVPKESSEFLVTPGSSPVLDPESPVVAKSLASIRSLLSESRQRCETLLATFQRHADTLESYEISLKQQLGSDRGFVNRDGWMEAIQRYRDHQVMIETELPLEQRQGLLLVDCRAMRRKLHLTAGRLAEACLTTLEKDAVECTSSINAKLFDLYQRLCQPLTGLPAVHAVKEVRTIDPHHDD